MSSSPLEGARFGGEDAAATFMKFSAQEEYGLRCLLRLALEGGELGMTIPEISHAEGISPSYVGKLMRVLRQGGLVKSSRGQIGGYNLSRHPSKIILGEALGALGGRLFEDEFCQDHAGIELTCSRSVNCSIRSLWQAVQNVVDGVLSQTTLADLLLSERTSTLVRISGDSAQHGVLPLPLKPQE